MISLKELNPHDYTLSAEQHNNLMKLHAVLNKIRADWGKPMIITSGVRSLDDQMRIDANRPGAQGKPARVRKGSMHIKAAAADISDRTGEFGRWLLEDHGKRLKDYDIYIESPLQTRGWIHIQIYPPGSGNRVYMP